MRAFDAMPEGTAASLEITVEAADVARFGSLSGDDNPIHYEGGAAAEAGYARPVVHGMLLGAWVSRLVGTRLPGHGAVLQSVGLEFLGPVFVGDALVITGTVKHRSEAMRTLVLAVEVRRGTDVVALGRALVGCR